MSAVVDRKVAGLLKLPQPRNQGEGINEYEPKRGNILGCNNFRMVNVIELASKSHKSQRFQGFRFIVDVHSPGSLFNFIVSVMG